MHHRRKFLGYLRRFSGYRTALSVCPRLLFRVGLRRRGHRRRRFFGMPRRSSYLGVAGVCLRLWFCVSLGRSYRRRFLDYLWRSSDCRRAVSLCLRLLFHDGVRRGVHRRRRFFGYLRRSLIRRCMCFVCPFSMAQVISPRPSPIKNLVGGSNLAFVET